MLHWLHHVIFEPLSAWERVKLDFLCSLIVVALMFFAYSATTLWFYFTKNK